jgi:hypothetical protein
MKAEKLYEQLKDAAERLGVAVSEHNLRKTGVTTQSGYCLIKGAPHYIMDKHLSIHRKNRLLAACLKGMGPEEVHMLPAVRDYMARMERD